MDSDELHVRQVDQCRTNSHQLVQSLIRFTTTVLISLKSTNGMFGPSIFTEVTKNIKNVSHFLLYADT